MALLHEAPPYVARPNKGVRCTTGHCPSVNGVNREVIVILAMPCRSALHRTIQCDAVPGLVCKRDKVSVDCVAIRGDGMRYLAHPSDAKRRCASSHGTLHCRSKPPSSTVLLPLRSPTGKPRNGRRGLCEPDGSRPAQPFCLHHPPQRGPEPARTSNRPRRA